MVQEFDGRHIDLDVREIRAGDAVRKLEPRAATVLATLLDRSGAVVSRGELLATCWPEGEGSDEALSQAIAQLRRALEDDSRHPRFVRTVHKSGYQWVARPTHPLVRLHETPIPAYLPRQPVRLNPRLAFAASVFAVLLVGAGVVGLTRQDPQSAEDRAFLAAGGRIDQSTQTIQEAGKVMEVATLRRRPPTSS